MRGSDGIRWSSARVMAEARYARIGRYSMVFGSYDNEGSMPTHTIYTHSSRYQVLSTGVRAPRCYTRIITY